MMSLNVPSLKIPVVSASLHMNSQNVIHSSSVYIAQPININLELCPKNQVSTSLALSNSFYISPFSSNTQISSSNLYVAPLLTNLKTVPPLLEGDCWNTAVYGWEQATLIKNKIGLVVNNRYKILQSIASGSYGAIFVAKDLCSKFEHQVAVKFDGACKDDHLKYEYDVYKSVLYDDGVDKVIGFPKVFWYGHEYGHNVLVMELLGAPLASLFAFCDRKFGKQTIVSMGEQMIYRIRHLHRRGFIHRDIKPENFLIGIGDMENTCYLIDFGLARRYRFRENRDLRHIPYRKGRSFVGTAKYSSLNSHKNVELSRRDDLESLGYLLVELINGALPWKNISKRNTAYTRHQTSSRICLRKEQANWPEICPSMAQFIKYCRDLPFTAEPNYEILISYIRSINVMCEPNINNDASLYRLKCNTCALKSSLDSKLISKKVIPNASIIHPLIPPHTISDNTVMQPRLSDENIICSISSSFIHPIDECITSLQSLSLIPACRLKKQIAEKCIDRNVSNEECKECRLKILIDNQQVLQYSKNLDYKLNNIPKMSWQICRESTLDRRFQYENRFSWTIPHKNSNFAIPTSTYNISNGYTYDLSVPPPSVPSYLKPVINSTPQPLFLPQISPFLSANIPPPSIMPNMNLKKCISVTTDIVSSLHHSLHFNKQSHLLPLYTVPAIGVSNNFLNGTFSQRHICHDYGVEIGIKNNNTSLNKIATAVARS